MSATFILDNQMVENMSLTEQANTSARDYVSQGIPTGLLTTHRDDWMTVRAVDSGKGTQYSKDDRVYLRLKRVGDVVGAALALVVLLPVLVVIALVVWAQDRGPVLYHQKRVGKDGRLFTFYKFRSMVRQADALKAVVESRNEADGPIFKMRQDPRVTRAGRVLRRYSLDELPQLWNVLIGDMSLVGPRPHLPAEVAQYRPGHGDRLKVQPGLLCVREVSGRSRLSFEEWVEMDLAYIQGRSLWADLKILGMAIPAILKADGAF
jgi:lipopolysaccharide/colanic/teichoic acid biosynthesis glycosyltransferase